MVVVNFLGCLRLVLLYCHNFTVMPNYIRFAFALTMTRVMILILLQAIQSSQRCLNQSQPSSLKPDRRYYTCR